MPLRISFETGSGKHQLSQNSNMTSALPTKPKYFIKGMADFSLTTSKLGSLEDS